MRPLQVFSSISAKKHDDSRMKSATFRLILSPTRYFQHDLAASILMVVRDISASLFVIDSHKSHASLSGFPSFFRDRERDGRTDCPAPAPCCSGNEAQAAIADRLRPVACACARGKQRPVRRDLLGDPCAALAHVFRRVVVDGRASSVPLPLSGTPVRKILSAQRMIASLLDNSRQPRASAVTEGSRFARAGAFISSRVGSAGAWPAR